MKTTIDAAGRLVIPKAVREQAGLTAGTPLTVRWREGRIEIEPEPLPVRLVRRGRLLVAVPDETRAALPAETVERTRATLRRARRREE